jgi:hypothetical protein
MDYEKKYKEALERARDYKNNIVHKELTVGESIMDYIFPELAESEDEKISYLKTRKGYTEAIKDPWIAWLEKQGKQKPNEGMIEALRTEYEKGRADVIADTLSWLENCWPKYCSNQTIIEGFKEAIKGE